MLRGADPFVAFIPTGVTKAPHVIIGSASSCTTISTTLPYHLDVSSNFSTMLIRTFLETFSPKFFKNRSPYLVK